MALSSGATKSDWSPTYSYFTASFVGTGAKISLSSAATKSELVSAPGAYAVGLT